MPAPENVAHATLQKITWNESEPRDLDQPFPVQFNPESLKLNFANQTSGREQTGGASLQYVGRGTSRLSIELWFDATGPDEHGGGSDRFPNRDVRDLTLRVLEFVKEAERGRGIPPGVRFLWGTFKFEGVVESINETLEFFSEDGRPLRANVSLTIAQQDIYLERNLGNAAAGDAGTASSAPNGPQLPDSQEQPFQQGASLNDVSSWQERANALGIDQPRLPSLRFV